MPDNFDITIEIQANGTALNGATANLEFDPAVLQIVSLSQISPPFAVPVGSPIIDNITGFLSFSSGNFTEPFPSGTFQIVTVTFKAVSGGSTTIDFSTTNPSILASAATSADVLQNTSGTSVSVSGPVNLPPTVAITNPNNGDNFIIGDDVTITANASDSDGSVSQVEFFDDGNSLGIDNTVPYEITLNNISAGSHPLTAIATDLIGSQTSSATVTITADEANVPPTVAITAPTDGAAFSTGDNVTITATAADSDGSIASVEFFDGAASLGIVNTAPFEIILSNISVGSHPLTAIATDNEGEMTTSSVVTISAADNVPPTVAITAPTDGAAFSTGDNVTITATAADSDGSITSVEFFDGAASLGIVNTAPFEIILSNISVGSHPLTAIATDNEGEMTTSSVVTISAADNVPPTVAITTPTDGAAFSTGDNVTITATAADSDGSITSVEFFDGAASLGIVNTAPFEIILSNISVGSHPLTAIATDNEGEMTTSSVVTISAADNVPPTVAITTPTDGAAFIIGDDVIITADATDADGTVSSVAFFDGATSLGTVNTTPFQITLNGITSGSHQLTAVATDDDGDPTTSAIVTITAGTGLADVVLTPSTTLVNGIGTTFTVLVEIQPVGGQAVDAATLNIDYDPSIIEVNDPDGFTVPNTPFNLPISGPSASGGTISYNGGSSTMPFPTSNFELFTIEFITVGTGTANLTFNGTNILANAGNDITRNTVPTSVTINLANTAPVFNNTIADQTDNEGDIISLDASATDPETNTITYAATNLPPGLSINTSTGEISGTISAGAAAGSVYAVTVTATDDGSPLQSASQSFNWTVTDNVSFPFCVNSGDLGAITAFGRSFAADTYFTDFNGNYDNTSNPISGTVPGSGEEDLFRYEKYGDPLNYAIPTGNGNFTVELYFTELYFGAPGGGSGLGAGARVFDIDLEGNPVETALDLFDTYGPSVAATRTYAVTVTDGLLNIDLDASVNNGKLSGICISETSSFIANAAPSISITPVADVQDCENDGEDVTLTATASDTEQGDLSAIIVWKDDQNNIVGTGASLNLTGLTGSSTYTAEVTDATPATTSASITVNVIANTPPALTAITTAPTTINADATVSLSTTASDVEDDDNTLVVSWSSDIEPGNALGDGASITPSLTAVGTHTITASVTDACLVTTTATTTVVVNTPPVVSITAPTDGATVNIGDDILITADASDTDGTITGVQLFDGATPLGTMTFNASSSLYEYTITAIAAGNYALNAVATDDGAESTTSTTVNITAAVGATSPVITVGGPATKIVDEGATLQVPISISDLDGDNLTVTVSSVSDEPQFLQSTPQFPSGKQVDPFPFDASEFLAINNIINNPGAYSADLDFTPIFGDGGGADGDGDGKYTITVEVSDGTNTVTETFELTVTDVPQAVAGTGTTRIEAESFDNQGPPNGTLDQTSDQNGIGVEIDDGFINIGFTQDGDFAEYQIDVTTAGTYRFDFFISKGTNVAGSMSINGGPGIAVSSADNNDWPNYSIKSVQVNLPVGVQTLRFDWSSSNTTGFLFNIDYFDLTFIGDPVAAFTATPNPANCAASVGFDAGGSSHTGPTNTIQTYEWDFDYDGITFDVDDTGITASNTYNSFGSVDVALRVTDNAPTPLVNIEIVTLDLVSTDPIAVTGGPYSITLGDNLLLDASGSSDPDVACADMITTYAWDLDYDGLTFTPEVTGVAATPTVTANDLSTFGIGAGNYDVVLRVTDSQGNTNDIQTTLEITVPVGPVALFTVTPNPANCAASVAFDAGTSTGNIVSYEWDFDYDGSTFDVDATGITTSNTYNTFGTLNVALRVTDNAPTPQVDIEIVSLDLVSADPIAVTGGPYIIALGDDLLLNGSGSTDPDVACGDLITTYAWDLNYDGLTFTPEVSGVAATPTVTANDLSTFGIGAGNYDVVLRVTDSQGNTNDVQTTLEITAPFELCIASGSAGLSALGKTFVGDPANTPPTGLGFTRTAGKVYGGYNDPIAGTTPGSDEEELFQKEIYGGAGGNNNPSFSYSVPVPTGFYRVDLYFAEVFHPGPNGRVFDVLLEGNVILDEYDLVDPIKDGLTVNQTAITRSYFINVSDGAVDIMIGPASTDNGKISGFCVTEVDSPNLMPTTAIGNLTADALVPAAIPVGISDPENDVLTVVLNGLPATLSYNAGTNQIEGTPLAGDAGTYTINAIIGDGTSSPITEEFELIINPPPSDDPPTIDPIDDQNVIAGTTVNTTIQVNDDNNVFNTSIQIFDKSIVPASAPLNKTPFESGGEVSAAAYSFNDLGNGQYELIWATDADDSRSYLARVTTDDGVNPAVSLDFAINIAHPVPTVDPDNAPILAKTFANPLPWYGSSSPGAGYTIAIENNTAENIGYIGNNEFVDYWINVTEAGTYDVRFAAAKGTGGTTTVTIYEDDGSGGFTNYPSGPGMGSIGVVTNPPIGNDPPIAWQRYADYYTQVVFTNPGLQKIRLGFSGGVNIRDFDFRFASASVITKVFLQGPFETPNPITDPIWMRDDLRSPIDNVPDPALIPLEDPYGFEVTISSTLLEKHTGAPDAAKDDIVDWVKLELRDPIDPSIIIAETVGLVQRDGDVVMPAADGLSVLDIVTFVDVDLDPAVLGTLYHLAIMHRNHLSIMTENAVVPTNAPGTN